MSEKIYVMLTHTSTVLSRVIRFFTREPYNHVSLALDNSLYHLYSFGRRNPLNPFIAGFVREDVEHGFYHYFNDTTCLIYEIEITEEQKEQLRRYLNQFLQNPYQFKFNFIGLIICGLHLPFSRKNHYFCSQFVSEALEKSGILEFQRDFRLVRPADFIDLPNGAVIYQGKLSDYTPRVSSLQTERTGGVQKKLEFV